MTNKKVWESLLLHDTKNSKPVDVSLTAPYPEGHVAFQDKYQAAQEIPKAEYPNYIYFKNRDTPKKKKDNLPDIFWGHLGLVFVSGAMRDLMQDFNFGRTRFIEMPFFEHDQKTPFRGRWYLMHILENPPNSGAERVQRTKTYRYRRGRVEDMVDGRRQARC